MKSRLALNLGLLALIAILAAVAVLKPGKKEDVHDGKGLARSGECL